MQSVKHFLTIKAHNNDGTHRTDFGLFTYNPVSKEFKFSSEKMWKYIAVSYEIGGSGTDYHHFHVLIQWITRKRMQQVKSIFNSPDAHLEIPESMENTNRYVLEGLEFDEISESYVPKSGQVLGHWHDGELVKKGQRTDLESACQLALSKGMKAVAKEMSSTYVRNYKGLQALVRELEPIPEVNIVLKPWQQELVDMVINNEPDDRHIIWVYDDKGGKGKSTVSKFLAFHHNACPITAGTGALRDLTYVYKRQPIVVFDIPRAETSGPDDMYILAEKLKDGFYTSTKYEPENKFFKPPHIICMSNYMYKKDKWTSDRVILIDLSNIDSNVQHNDVNNGGGIADNFIIL